MVHQRYLQIRIEKKHITNQKQNIPNCDASRRFKLFTGVDDTVLWWMRWQLHACKKGVRWIGWWRYVQGQRWPMDWLPDTKRVILHMSMTAYRLY
jgi:hypothetical protein